MISAKWNTRDTVYTQPTYNCVQIHFEYVSKYRRVVVVSVGTGFELRVSYKGLNLREWSRSYGVKTEAIGWAKIQINNRDIVTGCLTIVDHSGVQKIGL